MRRFTLLLAPLLVLLAAGCFSTDPCAYISTCDACTGQYADEGCTWCPLDETCSSEGESSCSASEELTDGYQCIEGAPAGSTGGSCTSSYQGPTGDPQVSTQCMAVWNYRCVQKNTTAADQNCLVYASLQATVSCPYCSGSSTGGGSTGGGSTGVPANSCNTSGVSPGCTASSPYSCSASSYCYTSLSACAAQAACQTSGGGSTGGGSTGGGSTGGGSTSTGQVVVYTDDPDGWAPVGWKGSGSGLHTVMQLSGAGKTGTIYSGKFTSAPNCGATYAATWTLAPGNYSVSGTVYFLKDVYGNTYNPYRTSASFTVTAGQCTRVVLR